MSDERFVVDAGAAGARVDKFLAHADRLGSRSRVAAALERGKVFINDSEATPADAARRLEPGDRVRVWMDRPGSSRVRLGGAARPDDLQVLYEDDALIVVNKPPGLLAVPLPQSQAASVKELLVAHLRPRGKRRPLVVHRIDRDTSGLVVFATRADAQQRLKDQFRRHEPDRVYLAVVYGHPSPAAGTWRDHLAWDRHALIQKQTHPRDPRGKEATSEYRVLEAFRDTSLIQVRLKTGKRNQIRIQARLHGHMLVGEQRYVYGPDELRPVEFPRQALHAHQLGFTHPVTGRPARFEAPLPQDMEQLVRRLRHDRR
jgi:23S rRNA pseudouridine1911/1915/1917 synthase